MTKNNVFVKPIPLLMIFVIFTLSSTSHAKCQTNTPYLILFGETHKFSKAKSMLQRLLDLPKDRRPVVLVENDTLINEHNKQDVFHLEQRVIKLSFGLVSTLNLLSNVNDIIENKQIDRTSFEDGSAALNSEIVGDFFYKFILHSGGLAWQGLEDGPAKTMTQLASINRHQFLYENGSMNVAVSVLSNYLGTHYDQWSRISETIRKLLIIEANKAIPKISNVMSIAPKTEVYLRNLLITNKFDQRAVQTMKHIRETAINYLVGSAIKNVLLTTKESCRDLYVFSGLNHLSHLLTYLSANFLEAIGKKEIKIKTQHSVHTNNLDNSQKSRYLSARAFQFYIEGRAFYTQGKMVQSRDKALQALKLSPKVLHYYLAILTAIELDKLEDAQNLLKEACRTGIWGNLLGIFQWYFRPDRDHSEIAETTYKLGFAHPSQLAQGLGWSQKFGLQFSGLLTEP